jgi:hypothetical protein
LLDQRLAALALRGEGRERGCGPSTLSRFLDRGIDLAETPVEVGGDMGLDADASRER